MILVGYGQSFAGTAGATTAVALNATTSTQILAANDLGAGAPRHFILVCNDGPGIGYIAFGTNNAATVTNGFPINPMQCLPPFTTVISPNGVAALPTQLDIAGIADSAAVPNIVVTDY